MAGLRISWLVLLSLATRALCEDLVPILAWANRDTFSSVHSSASNKLDISTLVQQSSFSKLGLVFVFRTEKLTFDDIAKYGGVYGSTDEPGALRNIQSEVVSSTSSLWGGAEGSVASQLVQEIAEKLDMSPNFISGMEDVAVIFGQPQLLVVDLPYGNSEEEFAQQDAMVAEVLEAVHHLGTSYAAFYTGMTTHKAVDNNAFYMPLLAKRGAPTLTTTYESCAVSYGVQDDDGSYCALLCLTNATILYWETEQQLEKGYSPCVANITAFNERESSGCNSSTIGSFPSIFATVEGYCSNGSEEMQVDIEFTFPQGNFEQSGQRPLEEGSWQMMILTGPFNLSRYGDGKLVYPFSIPIGASYACQSQSTATNSGFSNPNRFIQIGNITEDDEIIAAGGMSSPVIQFTGIHIQAHGRTYSLDGSPVFSPVWDCNGFFTLPSWMGIFSIVILLIILYVSLVFMFSMETVDRFEDPRAPTINVENLH